MPASSMPSPKGLTRMSTIRDTILGTMGPLIGIAIALIVVALVAGISIIGAQNSANLLSATGIISQFLSIVGIAVAIGVVITVLGAVGRR